MANILIIDDDYCFCDIISRVICHMGHKAKYALTLREGKDEAAMRPYDVVLLDVQLPDGNGLEAIEAIKGSCGSPEVIIATGQGNADGADVAIRWGACDYIEKPGALAEITKPIMRTLAYRSARITSRKTFELDRKRIVGDSPAVKRCLELVAQATRTDVNVLLTGETGTGKEVFARTIHENSARASRPFVVVECSALPESLVESILFGHEKGAFTGADRRQAGLIELADGGTLFLDEVGELPVHLQKAFLRVLQERSFRPVGAVSERASDFRLIAATNRNLEEMVKSGEFRSDLLFRLRTLAIDLPPLANRPQDICDLAAYYVAKCCVKMGSRLKELSAEFLHVLRQYDWPGNVRELFATLQSVLAMAGDEPVLYPNHLPVHIRAKVARFSLEKRHPAPVISRGARQDGSEAQPVAAGYKEFREKMLEQAEMDYFGRIVRQARGNVREACRLSELSRSRLYYFLQKYSLSLSFPVLSVVPDPEKQECMS